MSLGIGLLQGPTGRGSYERGTPVGPMGGRGATRLHASVRRVQGYLAQGGAFSYERGTPGHFATRGTVLSQGEPIHPEAGLQGYLAHKKMPPPRILQ